MTEQFFLKLYTIHDTKASSYTAPMMMRNSAEFIRGFKTLVNDGKSAYSLYPEDFVAYECGEFNDHTGELTSHPNLISVCRAADLKSTPSQ